jgi:hypothetical protein
VNGGGQIVAAPDVTHFVEHDSAQLCRAQSLRYAGGQQQYRPKKTDYAGLNN